MPPRHAYWTILVDDQPTAFRAHDPEELLATLNRLKDKHPSAVMKWFERGKLWESRDAAREAGLGQGERRWEGPRPDRTGEPAREKRDRTWRPGGEHRDPRQKYKDAKKAKWDRFKQNIHDRTARKAAATDPRKFSPPHGDPLRDQIDAPEKPHAPKARGPQPDPRDRPRREPTGRAPAAAERRPEGATRSTRPPAGPAGWKPGRESREPGGWKSTPETRGPGGWKPKPQSRGPGGWKPKPDARGPGGWKSKPESREPGGWKSTPEARGPGGWKPKPQSRGPGGWKPKPDARGPGGWKSKPDTRGPGAWKPKPDRRADRDTRPAGDRDRNRDRDGDRDREATAWRKKPGGATGTRKPWGAKPAARGAKKPWGGKPRGPRKPRGEE